MKVIHIPSGTTYEWKDTKHNFEDLDPKDLVGVVLREMQVVDVPTGIKCLLNIDNPYVFYCIKPSEMDSMPPELTYMLELQMIDSDSLKDMSKKWLWDYAKYFMAIEDL